MSYKPPQDEIIIHFQAWTKEKYTAERHMEIDWTNSFSRDPYKIPETSACKLLYDELIGIKNRIYGYSDIRKIIVFGRIPLSAGIAFGHIFTKSVFQIGINQFNEVSGKNKIWQSGGKSTSKIEFRIDEKPENTIRSIDNIVLVSISNDIILNAERYIAENSLTELPLLSISIDEPDRKSIKDDETARGLCDDIIKRIIKFTNKSNTNKIHLFISCPQAMAFMIGQRTNTLGRIQCYEFNNSDRKYFPTFLLGA